MRLEDFDHCEEGSSSSSTSRSSNGKRKKSTVDSKSDPLKSPFQFESPQKDETGSAHGSFHSAQGSFHSKPQSQQDLGSQSHPGESGFGGPSHARESGTGLSGISQPRESGVSGVSGPGPSHPMDAADGTVKDSVTEPFGSLVDSKKKDSSKRDTFGTVPSGPGVPESVKRSSGSTFGTVPSGPGVPESVKRSSGSAAQPGDGFGDEDEDFVTAESGGSRQNPVTFGAPAQTETGSRASSVSRSVMKSRPTTENETYAYGPGSQQSESSLPSHDRQLTHDGSQQRPSGGSIASDNSGPGPSRPRQSGTSGLSGPSHPRESGASGVPRPVSSQPRYSGASDNSGPGPSHPIAYYDDGHGEERPGDENQYYDDGHGGELPGDENQYYDDGHGEERPGDENQYYDDGHGEERPGDENQYYDDGHGEERPGDGGAEHGTDSGPDFATTHGSEHAPDQYVTPVGQIQHGNQGGDYYDEHSRGSGHSEHSMEGIPELRLCEYFGDCLCECDLSSVSINSKRPNSSSCASDTCDDRPKKDGPFGGPVPGAPGGGGRGGGGGSNDGSFGTGPGSRPQPHDNDDDNKIITDLLPPEKGKKGGRGVRIGDTFANFIPGQPGPHPGDPRVKGKIKGPLREKVGIAERYLCIHCLYTKLSAPMRKYWKELTFSDADDFRERFLGRLFYCSHCQKLQRNPLSLRRFHDPLVDPQRDLEPAFLIHDGYSILMGAYPYRTTDLYETHPGRKKSLGQVGGLDKLYQLPKNQRAPTGRPYNPLVYQPPLLELPSSRGPTPSVEETKPPESFEMSDCFKEFD